MKTLIVFVVGVLLLCACGPSAEAIQEAIAQTQAAIPTATFTQIPPSITLRPTFTARPTNTPRPTRTPTNTPTATPEPLTATAQAKQEQATQNAANITATAQERSARLTSTASAKSALATRIAAYKPIDLKELLTYPDEHKGEQVFLRGRIFNIDGKVVQIFVRGYDAIYIEMAENVSGIYEDDYITVYGIVYGSWCFENAAGNQVCQPGIFDAWYEKK